jgi:thioredoxin 1
MIEVRKIVSNEDLDNFLEMQPEVLHIVKFGTPWCGPCRTLSNTIRNLDASKTGDALFGSFEVDEEDTFDITERFNIINVPTMIYFKNKEEVNRTQGNISANILYETISKFL